MSRNNAAFIRWAGGKRWFIPEFKSIIQNLDFKEYYEPFLGGASIFFSLPEGHLAHLSDINGDLITMYKAVQANPEAVISRLQLLPIGKDAYYEIRSWEPDKGDAISIAARFLYLNHHSFNGIYRENAHGKYNVPYGYRQSKFDFDRIRWASNKLKDAVISKNDFGQAVCDVKAGDLVFLDPPYSTGDPPSKAFVSYTRIGFSLNDQKRLRAVIDHIVGVGAYFIMTNGSAKSIMEIFNQCGSLLPISRNCVISGKINSRGVYNEYVYTNIPCKDRGW